MVEGVTHVSLALCLRPLALTMCGPPQPRPPVCSTDLDIYGDGKIFLNDGTGFFSRDDRTKIIVYFHTQESFQRKDRPVGPAMFGDVNGDGYVDIMTDCQLYINDRSGAFSPYTAPPTIGSNNHAHSGWDFFFEPFSRTDKGCDGGAIGDIDNDGDLDFVMVYQGMAGAIDAIFRK